MPIPYEFDFKKPDYATAYRWRADRLARIRAMSPEEFGMVWTFYRDNPAQWVTDWGLTFDPRNVEIGLPAVVPFLLFKRQEEFFTWLYERWRNREDGLVEKSRDMGISWLCVAAAVHMWTFHAGTVVGFGSRKEEYVDKLGDPKSLFWKVRQFIDLLPVEFRPRGYQPKAHAPHMRIQNPDSGAVIVGEAGDNIGRGNRTSLYLKDESAFYERPDAIDAALSQTSNCKIDLSTPNGNGNAFYRKRHSGRIPVFTFHWRDDPRKDDAWYDRQVATLDSVIVAQEINIDYNASTNNAWINGESFDAAFKLGPGDVQALGPKIIGVDAAHFGDDESVIRLRRGRVSPPALHCAKLDGPDLAGRVADFADNYDGVDAIVIELDGPGVSCYDALKRHPKYGAVTVGVHTGARMNNGKDFNLRAKAWRGMRDWLEAGPVSVDRDDKLKSQACAMKYGYKDGLLLMQSKKEYKKEMQCSPDRADGLMLTFAIDVMPKKDPAAGVLNIPTVTHFNDQRR
jgi:phage terminase large subunit